MGLDFEYVKETEPNELKGFTKKVIRKKKEKEDVDSGFKELYKYIKENKIILGSEKTLKLIKLGKINKVFLSKNASEMVRAKLEHYKSLEAVELIELNYTSSELGNKLVKPFNVSIVGVEE